MFKSVLTEQDKEIIIQARYEDKSYNAISKTIVPSRMTIRRFCIEQGIAIDVSEKVMIANKKKGKLFEKDKQICVICKKEYKSRWDARSPCCGVKCAGAYRGIEKECKECGQMYVDIQYKPYCSIECYYVQRIQICNDCGESFINKRKKDRCDSCQQRYVRQVSVERYYRVREVDNKKKRDAYIWIPKDTRHVCLVCGGIYYTTQNNSYKRFCSNKCADDIGRQRRRANLRDAFIEDIHYGVVYRRDGGKCQICGRRVHKRNNINDNLAGSLDHIIALANGGKHSYSNIQLACRYCNSKKRDTKTWLQLDLIAT